MIRRIFETNTFGTMAMIQAVLPQFRTRKSGTIINVTSTVTLRPLPLLHFVAWIASRRWAEVGWRAVDPHDRQDTHLAVQEPR